MNLKHILIVFKKEMKDAFRDKKSVLTNIFLPLILIPLVYYFMNMAMSGVSKDVEENMKIAVISSEDQIKAEEFTKQNIIGENNIQIVSVESEQKGKRSIRRRRDSLCSYFFGYLF